MRISTVGYSAKQGVKNIGRNKMFSLASVATMAACIFVFGLFFLNYYELPVYCTIKQKKAWQSLYFLMMMQRRSRLIILAYSLKSRMV